MPEVKESTIDLRRFFQAVGNFGGQRALLTSPIEREDNTSNIEMLEDERQKITSTPLLVADWMDGIQASLLITHKDHRPIYLNYTAAGAVSSWDTLSGFKEKLEVVCSEVEWDWLYPLAQGLEVTPLGINSPPELEQRAISHLATRRASLEKLLAEELFRKRRKGNLVVDGSLLQRPVNKKIIGVIKSTVRKYLPDESVLWGMPAGWRSPMFKIPKGHGAPADRFSAYVRLFSANDKAWSFGLVRIETFDPTLINPMAARCILEKQNPAAGDPRFDRHLYPIRACEELLRARRPNVFTMDL